MSTKPVLQVIVGSTRPGRIGLPIAQWFYARAQHTDAFEVELVDLLDIDLPIFNEPKHPRLGDYQFDHTKRWSATVGRADAFAFVMPEYNHGINAALKNAVDYLHQEWQFKPAGFVSYGGVAAGTRAVQQMKQVCAALRIVPAVDTVHINFPRVEDGVFQADQANDAAADAMVAELALWTSGLREVRASRQ